MLRNAATFALLQVPALLGAQTLISFYQAPVSQGNGFWGDLLAAVRFESQASGPVGEVAFALMTGGTTQSITLELRALSAEPEVHPLDGPVLGSVTLGVGQFKNSGYSSDPANFSVFDFSAQNVSVTQGVSYAWVLSAVDPGTNTYLAASYSNSFVSSDPGMTVYNLDEDYGWLSFAPPFGAIHTASIIPEPSVFAAWAGLAALGCAAIRRRR